MATSRTPSHARRTAPASASSSIAAERTPSHAPGTMQQRRGGARPIEGRGAIASYDVNEDRLTLWSSTQLAHEVRAFLMMLLRLPEQQTAPGGRASAVGT